MENNCEKKKDKLYNELILSDYEYLYPDLIERLIRKGALDNIINNIKTITNTQSMCNLTGNEQFLLLLEDYIHQFQDDFYFLNKTRDLLIEVNLHNTKYNKYLLSKNCITDNKYMYFFRYHYKALVVNGFYSNLKKLSKKSLLIEQLMGDNKINVVKDLLLSRDGINQLFKLLREISFCNHNFFNISLLFEDIDSYINWQSKQYNKNLMKLKNNVYDFYITQWELMVQNYYKKIDAVRTVLDDSY